MKRLMLLAALSVLALVVFVPAAVAQEEGGRGGGARAGCTLGWHRGQLLRPTRRRRRTGKHDNVDQQRRPAPHGDRRQRFVRFWCVEPGRLLHGSLRWARNRDVPLHDTPRDEG